jgi:hypothetical protein
MSPLCHHWSVVFAACYSSFLVFGRIRDPNGIIFRLSLIVELVVNVSFGYCICKHHLVTKTILYFHSKYRLDLKLINQYYHYMTIVFALGLMIMLISCTMIYAQVDYEADDDSIRTAYIFGTIIAFIAVFLVMGASIYLCLLWCLQVRIISYCMNKYFGELIVLQPLFQNDIETSDIIQSPMITDQLSQGSLPFSSDSTTAFSKEITMVTIHDNRSPPPSQSTEPVVADIQKVSSPPPSDIDALTLLFPQQRIEKAVITYLEEMKVVSDMWQLNHIVRLMTGVMIVSEMAITCYISFFYEEDHGAATIFFGSAVIVYYGVIWISAFVAGVTNDNFFKLLLRKLSVLYADYGKVDDVLDKRINHCINKVISLRGVDGLQFAGVIMTKEKALTVGSVIASIIVFAIRMYTNDSSL